MFISLSTIIYILYVAAQWKMFEKAGIAGWKSLIPIYNVYTQFQLSWKGSKFFMLLWYSLLLGVGTVVVDYEIIISAILIALGGLGVLLITVQEAYYLAKSFGHGIDYTLGLLIFPNLMVLILGFGESEYVGNGYAQSLSEKVWGFPAKKVTM